jgi:hypothetical protein
MTMRECWDILNKRQLRTMQMPYIISVLSTLIQMSYNRIRTWPENIFNEQQLRAIVRLGRQPLENLPEDTDINQVHELAHGS